MPARRFPCFSSRVMLARDDAVSAVSLPAKKADSRRQKKTMTKGKPVGRGHRLFLARDLIRKPVSTFRDHALSEFFAEESANLGRIDIILDERLADATH